MRRKMATGGETRGRLLTAVALLATACLNDNDERIHQAFYMAVQNGDERAVARMLSVERTLASTPWRWQLNDSTLYREQWPAFAATSVGVLRLLLDHGVSLEATEGKTTLLVAAAYRSNPEVVRYLLERGASVSARDGEGFSALDWAVIRQSATMAVRLCAHGAGPGKPWAEGRPGLSSFVVAGGGCTDLPALWKATPADQREAWTAAQACRVDPYACAKAGS